MNALKEPPEIAVLYCKESSKNWHEELWRRRLNFMSAGELFDADLGAGPKYLVEHILSTIGCGIVGGQPKAGKSYLVLLMAISIITGRSFLGMETYGEGASVIYIAGEGGARALRGRIRQLCRGCGVDPEEIRDKLYLSIAPSLSLDRDPNLSDIRAAIENIEPPPAMVIFDPLTRLHQADENSRNEVEPMLSALRRLSEDKKTFVLLVHHTAKHAASNDPLRGSSAFRAWHDSLLWIEDSSPSKLRGEFRDSPELDPLQFKLAISEEEETAQVEILEGSFNHPDKTAALDIKVLDLLRNSEKPLTATNIRDHLHCSGNRVNQVLERLVKRGEVESFERTALNGKETSHFQSAIEKNEQQRISEY